MSNSGNSLGLLVNILDDGIGFYEEVSTRTSNYMYLDVFASLRNLKAAIAADLNTEISLEGEQPTVERTWLGALRISYTQLLAKMSEHPSHAFISQVESQEDRVLEVFRTVGSVDSSDRVRKLANLYLPEIKRVHDEVRELRQIAASESIRH